MRGPPPTQGAWTGLTEDQVPGCDGYTYDEMQQGCVCTSDVCCPTGFVFDASPTKNTCVCNSDSCCPIDHQWDATKKECV